MSKVMDVWMMLFCWIVESWNCRIVELLNYELLNYKNQKFGETHIVYSDRFSIKEASQKLSEGQSIVKLGISS